MLMPFWFKMCWAWINMCATLLWPNTLECPGRATSWEKYNYEWRCSRRERILTFPTLQTPDTSSGPLPAWAAWWAASLPSPRCLPRTRLPVGVGTEPGLDHCCTYETFTHPPPGSLTCPPTREGGFLPGSFPEPRPVFRRHHRFPMPFKDQACTHAMCIGMPAWNSLGQSSHLPEIPLSQWVYTTTIMEKNGGKGNKWIRFFPGKESLVDGEVVQKEHKAVLFIWMVDTNPVTPSWVFVNN